MEKTTLQNYGVNHPSKSPIVRKRAMATVKRRFGTYYYAQSEDWKQKYKPENHPKWKGGKCIRDYRLKHSYTKWRKEILEKCNYTCVCCGKNEDLNVHHIFSGVDNPEMRLDTNNGTVLCFDCHRDFHKKFGYGGNNSEQLESFLNNHGKNIV